jgi:hypothetical protein
MTTTLRHRGGASVTHDLARPLVDEQVTFTISRYLRGESITCVLAFPLDTPNTRFVTGAYRCGIVIFGGHEPPGGGYTYDSGTYELRRLD